MKIYFKVLFSLIAICGLLLQPISPAIAASPKAANGQTCKILGTARSETIRGTNKDDVICGLGGNDIILGNSGNDFIDGGAGNDTILAGDGNDKVLGIGGNDNIQGGEGNDFLDGGAGNDFLNGGLGDDGLIGGSGLDDLNGVDAQFGEPTPEDNICEPVSTGEFASNCGFDENPPVIMSLTTDKVVVNTTNAKAVIKITMHITDELMGVDQGGCLIWIDRSWADPGSQESFKRIQGDARDGYYTCEVELPRWSKPGQYFINASAFDTTQKHVYYHTQDHGLAISQVGSGDLSGPKLENIFVSSKTIDASLKSTKVLYQIQVSDDLSGVNQLQCTLFGASMDSFLYSDTVKLISANKLMKTFLCSFTFPKYSAQGNWYLSVNMKDFAGLERNFTPNRNGGWSLNGGGNSNTPITAETALLAANTVSQVGLGDISTPELNDFVLSTTHVDTRNASKTVAVALHITDDLAGLRYLDISLHNQSGGVGTVLTNKLTRGSIRNGVWTLTIGLPKGSASGTWYAEIFMMDFSGRRKYLTTKADFSGWQSQFISEKELLLQPILIQNG